jgi:beta-1,4-mannosyltransferase
MRILAWPTQSQRNPYPKLLYSNLGPTVQVEEFSARKILERYSVWHVHWPDELLIGDPLYVLSRIARFLAAVDCLRMRGTKIVWTIHNCSSHEKLHPSLEAWFWRRFIPRVDGVISLSSSGLSNALESFPALRKIPKIIIPHGHYRDEYPFRNRDARPMLGIPSDARVLLFFGQVRPYKNVETLVRVFREVTTDSALLDIVGHSDSSTLSEKILREASSDNRVRVRLEFLRPDELFAHASAADVVVLPYREILNSGSAILGLSLNRPILVPDLGAMGDLKADFGETWVRTFSGDLSKNILEGALDWAAQTRPSTCPMPAKYEWESIGRETVRFYEMVASKIPNYLKDSKSD